MDPGYFKNTSWPGRIEISWDVSGFGRPDEQTEVIFHVKKVNHSTYLTIEHKNILSLESYKAKKRAWSRILDTFADEMEIDVSMLEHNLALSSDDRIIEHQRALELLIELGQAGEMYYGQPK